MPSDHSIVHERVAVTKMLKNRASVRKERSILGGCSDGEERRNSIRILVQVGFEEMGMDLLELFQGLALL